MATADRPRRPASGGKIVGRRSFARAASPYSRPTPPPPESPRRSPAPLWLVSAARTLAAGAGKILSVFRSDDDSHSSSGSDAESNSETSSTDADENDEALSIFSEENEDEPQKDAILKDLTAPTQRIGIKHIIEQLLLQETFTREECVKLTKLIESRVVDSPASKGLDGARTNEISSRVKSWSALSSPSIQAHTPDIAVMEAKKWIQEKSLVKTKALESDHGPCTLNTTASYDDLRDGGSPVDLAKSYMSSRPPWASPSSFKFGFRTPPSTGSHYFNDKNPTTCLASSKLIKRVAQTTGSENTTNGLRQVRLKLLDDSSEPLAISSGINVPNQDAIVLSDHNVRIENSIVQGVNNSLAPRQEGSLGELNTRLPSDSCCENVVKLRESLASGQNIAGPVLLERNVSDSGHEDVTLKFNKEYVNGHGQSISLYGNGAASHIAVVPDKSEDSPEVGRINEDSQEDSLQNFLNQEIIVLHHNGEVPVVKEYEQAVTAAQDAKACLLSMSAASAAPLMELHNHGGHISLSSHSQGVLAVSNSEGSHDVLSEASASLVDKSNATGKTDLVGDSDAVEVLSQNQKGRVAARASRNVTRRKKIVSRGGQGRKK